MQEHNQQSANENLLRELLTEKEAAIYLGLENHQTLAVWRCNKRYQIPYIKIGRNVRYRIGDLKEWIDSRTCTSAVAAE